MYAALRIVELFQFFGMEKNDRVIGLKTLSWLINVEEEKFRAFFFKDFLSVQPSS